jgi:hypothetical protein
VTRESRIEQAKRMAAETSEKRSVERAADAERRANEIVSMGSDAAITEAGRIKSDGSIG